MPDATLGGLFGGLAQGAEAGMRLNQQQQYLGLQQQNQQRMQEIEKRQTAMQFYSAFVNTLQLDPNERGPALDKLEETAQGMGVPVDPAMFEHARKLTRDQSDALIQTINAAVPGMSTDALMNLPKNYLGTMLPLLIQSRYRQELQKGKEALGQPGTGQGTPQSPAVAPGSTISPQAPTQVSPQGAQGQPTSELNQLKALYAANDQKLTLLSQYGTVVPEAKEEATILNSQQQRIQQRIQHLEGSQSQLMTPPLLNAMIDRALAQNRPDLKPGTPAYQSAHDEAYANYAKWIAVQQGGEAFGGAIAFPKPSGSVPAGGGSAPQGGPQPLAARQVQPTAPEIDKVSGLNSFIARANELADLIEKKMPDDASRADYQKRFYQQKIPFAGTQEKFAFTKDQQAISTAAGMLLFEWERANGGQRMAAASNPAFYQRLLAITSNPAGAQAPTALRTMAKQQQKSLDELLKTQGKADVKPLGTPSKGKTPQEEAEEFLRGR